VATFFLGGRYARFHAIAAAGRTGTVIFRVVVDGREVYDSGLLKTGGSREVDVPLAGAQEIRLVIDDGGNGIGGDWASWADAWVEAAPQ
jgi:hypothetical protein